MVVLVDQAVAVVTDAGLSLVPLDDPGDLTPVVAWPEGSSWIGAWSAAAEEDSMTLVAVAHVDGDCLIEQYGIASDTSVGTSQHSILETPHGCAAIGSSAHGTLVLVRGPDGDADALGLVPIGAAAPVWGLSIPGPTATELVFMGDAAGDERWLIGAGSTLTMVRIDAGGGAAVTASVVLATDEPIDHLLRVAEGVAVATAGARILRIWIQADDSMLPSPDAATAPGPLLVPPVGASDCPPRFPGAVAPTWCADGILIAGGEGWMRGWRVTTGETAWSVALPGERVTGLALTADGSLLAALVDDYGGGAWRLRAHPATEGPPDTGASVLAEGQGATAGLGGPVVACDGTAAVVARGHDGSAQVEVVQTGATGLAPGTWAAAGGSGGGGGRAVPADACPPSWHELPSLAIPRGYACGAFLDGRVYMAGGMSFTEPTQFGPPSAAFEVLELGSGAWSPRPSLPVARGAAVCEFIGRRLYVAGGWTASGTASMLHLYDVDEGAWKPSAPMSSSRGWAASAVLDEQLYVIGGAGGGYLATAERYDPQSGAWTPLGSLSAGRYLLGAAATDDAIYVVGGDDSDAQTTYDLIERYDPVTDTWEVVGHLPEPLAALQVVPAVGGLALWHESTGIALLDPLEWNLGVGRSAPALLDQSSAVIATPDGLVMSGGGAWGPNHAETWLLGWEAP